MIKDEEIKNCQIITKEYYLEKAYGFQIKQIMANIIADIPVYNFIYQHDYRKNLIKNALVGFFENQTLNFALPSKYDNLILSYFRDIIKWKSIKRRNKNDFSEKEHSRNTYVCGHRRNSDIPCNTENRRFFRGTYRCAGACDTNGNDNISCRGEHHET